MKRGDIVIASLAGDYGKPRPAVIIQTNHLHDVSSLIICPITSEIRTLFFRVLLEPSLDNGLQKISQIMTDKVTAIATNRIKQKIGSVPAVKMREVEKALLFVLGFA